MKVLVTGGAGYIGSKLIPLLKKQGYEVRLFDNFSRSTPRNLAGNMDIDFVRGDVRDEEKVAEAVQGVDKVIHLAAITGARKTHEIRQKTFDINYQGAVNVLEAAQDEGVEKMVFASSCNNYGRTEEKNLKETSEMNPINPYAESKVKAEKEIQNSDLNTVSLRLATNYGWSHGVRFNLVVNKFVFRGLMGEPLTIYGDGTNWRPFLNVNDSARAFKDALDWDEGVYNVGDDNYQIEQIAETVRRVTGNDIDITYLKDKDPGPSYHVDFNKVKEQTGFETKYDMEKGVKHLVKKLKGR